MLVLTRKVNESIVIGGIVTITITEIKGNRVKVGVIAPTGVKVLRGELPPDTQFESQRIRSKFRMAHAKVPDEPSTVPFPPDSRKQVKPEKVDRNKRDDLEALNDAA